VDSVGGGQVGLPTPVAVATVLTAIQGALSVLIGLVLVGRGRRIRRLGIGMNGPGCGVPAWWCCWPVWP